MTALEKQTLREVANETPQTVSSDARELLKRIRKVVNSYNAAENKKSK